MAGEFAVKIVKKIFSGVYNAESFQFGTITLNLLADQEFLEHGIGFITCFVPLFVAIL